MLDFLNYFSKYFLFLWTWIDLYNCLNQQNMADTASLPRLWLYKGCMASSWFSLSLSGLLPFIPSQYIFKKAQATWRGHVWVSGQRLWPGLSEVTQSCPTLCNPMYCSLPGSSLHGILQARVLEWVAISFSRGSSQPRDRTQVSRIPGRRFNLWAMWQ